MLKGSPKRSLPFRAAATSGKSELRFLGRATSGVTLRAASPRSKLEEQTVQSWLIVRREDFWSIDDHRQRRATGSYEHSPYAHLKLQHRTSQIAGRPSSTLHLRAVPDPVSTRLPAVPAYRL